MIYKLLHKLFGWHYVWVKKQDNTYIIRVKLQPNGELKGKISIWNFYITPDGKCNGAYITDWRPLTWKLEKEND